MESAVNQPHAAFCEVMWFGQLTPRSDAEDSYQTECYLSRNLCFTQSPANAGHVKVTTGHQWGN